MLKREDVSRLIRECLGSVNAEREDQAKIALTDDSALLDDETSLDSLEFMSFVADLESRLAKATGQELALASEALSSATNPFRTIGSLTDHVLSRIGQ